MTRESNLVKVSSIDDNSIIRVVLETGESRNILGSILKQYIGEGTATPFIEVVGEGDDRGLICTEQWVVGKPSAPKESVFGGGDSYGVGLEDGAPGDTPKVGSAWHCDIANTVGNTITGASDVTTIFASDSGSTSGLFAGVAAGKYLLVGSDYTYGGAKIKINTLGTIEPDNVIGEYLVGGTTWQQVPYMATDAEFPYAQKADQLATCSSCSEHWRFGFDPDNLPVPWAKVTLNINGTNYTKFWARFRITSAITLDPIIEQIKLHTNRTEINPTGFVEKFGIGRTPITLLSGLQNLITNVDGSAQNRNIQYASGITAARTSNRFRNNFVDDGLLAIIFPYGLDTSIPILVDISYYVDGIQTGDVEFQGEAVLVEDGFVYDGTAPTIPYSVISPVISPSLQERKTVRLKIFGNKIIGGEGGILLRLFRDATGGNPDDTVGADVVLTNIEVIGYSWIR